MLAILNPAPVIHCTCAFWQQKFSMLCLLATHIYSIINIVRYYCKPQAIVIYCHNTAWLNAWNPKKTDARLRWRGPANAHSAAAKHKSPASGALLAGPYKHTLGTPISCTNSSESVMLLSRKPHASPVLNLKGMKGSLFDWLGIKSAVLSPTTAQNAHFWPPKMRKERNSTHAHI